MAAASRRSCAEALRVRPAFPPRGGPRTRTKLAWTAAGLAGAWALAVSQAAGPAGAAQVSWAAGALALGAGILGSAALVDRLGRRQPAGVIGLGLGNLARAPRRSSMVVGVLGAAVFVVALVALGGERPAGHASPRQSGTGGFAFIGETALPLRHDLNQETARRALGLPRSLPARFVPLRVRDGDEAGCRNLNRVFVPRIVGVDPQQLASRSAFSFAQTMPGLRAGGSWSVLEEEFADGSVPALADSNVITWSLQAKLGEVMTVSDDTGAPLRLRFVAALEPSILQGNVVVAERAFERHFPTVVGHRGLLVDADTGRAEEVAAALGAALADHGLDLTPAEGRLAELRAVEDAYLTLFLALGALGLLFGTAGCAAIVARDLSERAGELASLRAMGFGVIEIERLLVSEHGTLFALGVGCGALAAVIACAPETWASAPIGAYGAVALVCMAVVTTGVVVSRLACRLSMRRDLGSVLRRE